MYKEKRILRKEDFQNLCALNEWCGFMPEGTYENMLLNASKTDNITLNQIINYAATIKEYSLTNEPVESIMHKIANACLTIIYKDKDRERRQEKHRYGEYGKVLLTDEELNTWKKECPLWKTYLDNLDEYIAMKGDKYKSHLATLRNWYRKDKSRGELQHKNTSYNLTEHTEQVITNKLVYKKKS